MSAIYTFADGTKGVGEMSVWIAINQTVCAKLFEEKRWSNELAVATSDAIYFDLVERGFLE